MRRKTVVRFFSARVKDADDAASVEDVWSLEQLVHGASRSDAEASAKVVVKVELEARRVLILGAGRHALPHRRGAVRVVEFSPMRVARFGVLALVLVDRDRDGRRVH